MPTIAELQINVDSSPTERATKALVDFANAADKAATAGKNKRTSDEGSAGAASKNTKAEQDLNTVIDIQARKLANLAEQRKKLEGSGKQSSAPEEYKRLNAVIDANIALVTRQGNAVDALNTKQGQDFLRRESMVNAEIKAQDKLVKQTENQARAVSTAAAQQNAQIETTIAGLDRQVKAQLQYNQTIDKLNKARALSGMGGKDDQSAVMSSAEYDTWTKLAAARRDAAFALEDNSKASASAQAKLSSMEATLGKIERAEHGYARAVTVLDDNLKKGLLTTDQYDAKLSAFANKRDKAIKAANDNSVAEARFASQLQSVVGAFDPVQRAQDNYNASVKVLSQGLKEGKISTEAYNKALAEQKVALDNVKDSSKGNANLSSQYQDALKDLIPYRKELDNLAERERILQAQKAAGKVTTAQQIADYDQATAAIQRQRKEYEKRIKAGEAAGITFKQEQAAMRGLPAQFTDIVVSLQGGQAPLTVLLQQGGQIKDMFGGLGPAISAVGRGLMAIITPATLAATAVALIAYEAYQGNKELTDFNKAVVASGGYSGTSASQFSSYREQIAGVAGNAAKAADALTAMEKSGKIAGDLFVQIGTSAIQMQKATGQSIQQTVDDFASLAKDPVSAVTTLDDKYKFLTASVLTQIDALVKQGDIQGAVTLAQKEMADATSDMASKMVENLGWAETAWNSLKSAVSGVGSAIAAVGRENTLADQMNEITRAETNWRNQLSNKGLFGTQADVDKRLANDPQLKLYDERKKQLQILIDFEKFGAEQTAQTERDRQRAVTEQGRQNVGAAAAGSPVEKARKELDKAIIGQKFILDEAAKKGEQLTAEQLKNHAVYKADLERKLKEALAAEAKKGAGGFSPAKTQELQEVKSNLDKTLAEYDGYYKKATALGEANIVSQAATSASLKATLEKEKEAVAASYDEQISAIKNLQDKKSNSAATNISLDNQLTKAEAARVKSLEEIDTKLEVLSTKEKGRVADRTASIEAYNDALRQQIENTRIAGQRAVSAVGKGDRQGQLDDDLGQADRDFAKEQLKLSKQKSTMDPEEYSKNLENLKAAHTDMKDLIVANDKEIQAANGDWTNGFTKALENATDDAANFADMTNNAVSGAFDSMGDALAKFATTGKLNFKDFATSVIANMAEIAAQQASSAAMSALLGMAMTVGSAYFGGGAGNGLASGSAGAVSSNVGASAAGYSSTYIPQAKGGGWTGGTQFFAQGGAFTNSVVSSPTSFGMSGGRQGVMGEAGPEAIVPLARASDGSLGVRMMGAGGGGNSGGVNVFVNITDSGSSASSDEPGLQQFGTELGNFVDARYRQLLSRDLKDGGAIKTAIKS